METPIPPVWRQRRLGQIIRYGARIRRRRNKRTAPNQGIERAAGEVGTLPKAIVSRGAAPGLTS